MAVYKVPQDVEAEDKLIGPLSLKQFIFAIVAAVSIYLIYLLGRINLFLIVIPLPVTFVFGTLALPLKKDQPLEIYLLARLRFMFKPRRRIWDQDGVMETVRITAPKNQEMIRGGQLSPNDVKSSLKNLAKIMDTRGWSAKNAIIQEGSAAAFNQTDRLITPQTTPTYTDVHESDDILDVGSNPVAQRLDTMEAETSEQVRQAAVAQMHAKAQTNGGTQAEEEEDFTTTVRATYNPYPQMRQHVLKPHSDEQQNELQGEPEQPSTTAMTPQSTPVILEELARDNNRSVQSLAKEAEQVLNDDEAVSLR